MGLAPPRVLTPKLRKSSAVLRKASPQRRSVAQPEARRGREAARRTSSRTTASCCSSSSAALRAASPSCLAGSRSKQCLEKIRICHIASRTIVHFVKNEITDHCKDQKISCKDCKDSSRGGRLHGPAESLELLRDLPPPWLVGPLRGSCPVFLIPVYRYFEYR